LPVWNAAATIRAALASIKRQSHPHWECIVVDDGSADGTADTIARLASDEPRIQVVRTPHRGIVSALNEGLARCGGSFVARMDADDVMRRDRLARQVCALDAQPDLAAVGSHVRIFPRRPMTSRLRDYERWLNSVVTAEDVQREAFVECPVAHPSLMMRPSMSNLGYRDASWAEDYDLVLRALVAGLRIGVVPRRLIAWRDRPDSLCRTDSAYIVERFTACKAHYLASSFLREVNRYVLWGYGETGRTLRRALAEHGKSPSHIVEVKRSRIGQRIHGAPVIAVEALPALRGARIVTSVARSGPRSEIRSALAAMGFVEGADFVCAA
jgi:glycosyltransferase involved in cell wall biosynthesis